MDTVALCAAYAHAASASDVSQRYLARCLHLSTVKSDISFRLQALRSRGIGRGCPTARMERRGRLAEPAVGFVARRHLQAPQGASSSCAYRTNVAFPNVVVISSRPRSVSCRSAAAKVQCLASAHRINRALPKHGRPSASTLLSSWQQTLTRRALND